MKSHRVEHFGDEREPIIVIDDFTGRIADFAAAGRRARYSPVSGYPGLRSPVDPAYLALGEPLLGHLLAEHFGLSKRFQAESCSFSVVSIPPDKLTSGILANVGRWALKSRPKFACSVPHELRPWRILASDLPRIAVRSSLP